MIVKELLHANCPGPRYVAPGFLFAWVIRHAQPRKRRVYTTLEPQDNR